MLAAGFELRAGASAVEASAVLRALLKSSSARATRWVVQTGKSLRPVSRAAPGAVCLPSPERLLVVRQVLRRATAVRVYAPVDARMDEAGRLSCTCLWWAKYRGGRGPCEHALAVRIVQDQSTEGTR